MTKVIFGILAAVVVSFAGQAAFAEHNPDDPNFDKHYMKEQCKDGGWREMGFKNQGQCVSHFASGGRSNNR